MRLHHERLKAKGWSADELDHARSVLDEADRRKHPAHGFLEVAVYWGLLFLLLVGIFVISLVIVPALLVLNTAAIALVLVTLGLCLGALFAILIPDIEWLEKKHHAFNFVVLAFVAVLNVWFIVSNVDKLSGALDLPYAHNAWLLGGLFAGALLLPYIVHLVMRR